LDNSSSFLLAVFKAVECIKGVKSLIAAARPKSQSGVGYAATQAFRESEDSHAVQPLISALSHADPDIRCIAAKVLGGLKDPRAIDPLIAAALQERNPAVVSSAAQAFEEITAQRPWSDLAKWWEE
jgi:HEAT repeat protein